jgi:protoporphyrinogen oxidase
MSPLRPCDVLLLGGGPAGMAAAMELSRAGRHVTIIEKSSHVGGLAKTLSFNEPEGVYRTDIGPHRFFSKNQYLYDFIQDLLGEEWRQVPRQTRFHVAGKYYDYPIRLGNALKHMGLWKAFRVLTDYLWERVRAIVAPRQIHSFEDYAVRQFGWTLAEFNMLQYTEKIWGLPCKEISVDWAHQRIGGLSLVAILKGLFTSKGGPKTLVDTFYYPQFGSGTIYEAIKRRLLETGSEILTSSEPTNIVWEGSRVKSVTVKTQNGEETYEPKAVISSIPITRCVELFHPSAPQAVHQAAKALRFRAQVYLFLTIKKDRIAPDNWLYFPDRGIPFGRIAEMKNFSKDMCPPGHTSLFIEFFCFEGDDIWNKSKDELYAITLPWLKTLDLIDGTEVGSVHHFKAGHVYPLYDLTYHEHMTTVLNWMDTFENFFAIGRPGRFRYTNQDHSLEMGILAAQSVLTGTRKNVDDVGAEKDYFEKGFVPGKKQLKK